MKLINNVFLAFLIITLGACDSASTTQTESRTAEVPKPLDVAQASTGTGSAENTPPLSESERLEKSLKDIEDQMGVNIFVDPWTGDLDAMMKERLIRVLTVYGVGRYYLDGGQEKGITYEWFKQFEDFVNEKLDRKHLRVHVVFIPVARDQLLPGLISGRGDLAAAGLTITDERAELVDFSDPVSKELSELLVTGPTAPQIDTIEDLAGRKVYVRASSSYRASLDTLNQQFQEKGLEAIGVGDIPEQLEDMDILEMVNAGMLEWAVVDDYKARIWAGIFDGLKVREDIVLRAGGKIGVAFRKDSPRLAGMLNEFVKTHKQGTLQGNILLNRYLKNFNWAQNAVSAGDYQRFQDVVDIFSKYGDQYGVDYLMVAAQGYQESRLDQNARSGAGAIGIMQLLPTTAADANVGIPDISNAENNIHAGVKYLDFIRNRYFSDPEVDIFNQTLFAFAAYNAGPARIRKLRTMASQQGYDPNVWFDNVEVMAARDIGKETVQYVANILKYYVAYSMAIQQQLDRQQKRKELGIE
ncbi:MAG: lytic transglycosylase F [Xanthomonadales bacterium]|nr:lytic transglycosylase F [Xanthomonadales bacterium]